MRSKKHHLAKASLVLSAAALAAALIACNSSDNEETETVTIHGAGSSFVYPVMSRWTHDYNGSHPNIQINYQSIGSGGGVQQVRSGTIDFGASDYALEDDELNQMKPVLQIPETAGPVCITYNLPGLAKPLQLSPDALAGIFLGKITSWETPSSSRTTLALSSLTPGSSSPHRSDGSGTTAAFTTYLSAVSDEWKTKVGKGSAVSWPAGLGGKGSEGVTAQVRQSPGGIGYVELIYAQQNKLPIASVRNLAGKYIQPSTASTTAAIAAYSDQLSKDPRIPIVNPPAAATDAYPISTLTFLIIPRDGTDLARHTALKGFIQYIIGDGQSTAGKLNYAPLPDGVKQYDKRTLDQMSVNGKPIP